MFNEAIKKVNWGNVARKGIHVIFLVVAGLLVLVLKFLAVALLRQNINAEPQLHQPYTDTAGKYCDDATQQRIHPGW